MNKTIINIESAYDINNDGIGPYEYWGQKYVDVKPDYVQGDIAITFEEEYTEESLKEIKDEFEFHEDFYDEVMNSILDEVYGEDEEFEFSFDKYKGKIILNVSYTASLPSDV